MEPPKRLPASPTIEVIKEEPELESEEQSYHQINQYPEIEEAMDMPQPVNIQPTSREVPPLPAPSDQYQEEVRSNCIVVEAEIHDY